MNPGSSCDLCGLPNPSPPVFRSFRGQTLAFCCGGCARVYQMLLEATQSPDPADFKNTELFRRCQDMGIIPSPPEKNSETAAEPVPEPANPVREHQTDSTRKTLPLTLKVRGMWCPACAWLIETLLEKQKGVASARCIFSTDRLFVEYDPVITGPEDIRSAIDHSGYSAFFPGDDHQGRESRALFIRLTISLMLTANVMMLSFAAYSGFFMDLSPEAVWKIAWPMAFLAGTVLLYGGWPILRKAVSGIRSLAMGMETLIALGSFTAFVYSLFHLVQGSVHLYFDTAAMLITLTLVGKTLEAKVKDRVQAQLEAFFSLAPSKARKINEVWPSGRWVSIDGVLAGDILEVETGEGIPADGRMLSGEGLVDESMLTGEPRPGRKKPGDDLTGGTRLKEGSLRLCVTSVGKDSRHGRMMAILEEGLARKFPAEQYAERMLRGFVPAILLLAAGSGGIGFGLGLSGEEAMVRAVTILVIACPCALGIAIPLVRVASLSLAARKGILVRRFEAFEAAGDIDTLVFDKTGTVTRGNWELLALVPSPGYDPDQLLAMALGLERDSDHDIARALRAHGIRHGIAAMALDEVTVTPRGVTACLGERQIKIGSSRFLKEIPDPWPAGWNLDSNDLHSQVYLAVDGKMAGLLVFGDQLRPDAASTLESLKKAGYNLLMVSGDGEEITRKVAGKLGVDKAMGGKSPEEKARIVESLNSEGRKVLMAGDGINDAPAMAMASVGVAMAHANGPGREAGDITLIHGNLGALLDFFDLAGKARTKIRQNFWFAFVYNIISIPIAMSGLLTPLIAVTAMLFSSLTVITNTLLLYGGKRDLI